MKKIGVYGGTFDPVHHGHLILAREAREELQLDNVLLVPAAVSPHKTERRATAPQIRLEMLRAAVRDEPHLAVDDRELRRPPPSYTIDTVESLAADHPATQLFYLIGADQLARLETWHRFADLRRLVTFVVLDRGEGADDCPYQRIRRQIEISATEIRNRVARGESIRYLVPPAVEEIIRRDHLYQDTAR